MSEKKGTSQYGKTSPQNIDAPKSGLTGQAPSSNVGGTAKPRDKISTYGATNIPRKVSVYNKGKAMAENRPLQTPEPCSDNLFTPEKIGCAAYKIFLNSKYKVLKLIGTGSYAQVYKVESRKGKIRAAKVIDVGKSSKNYRLKFMPRELEILQKISDPNIIKVYEIIKAKHTVVIIMEFASQGTLTDLIRNGPLPEERAREIFNRVVTGITYMHSKRIAHRDLKLENILVDHEGNPKLADFSYSIICTDKEGKEGLFSKTFCGTLPYLSPEMLQELPYDPLVADIWSLGICLYVVVNNKIPFKFEDTTVMIKNQVERKWSFGKKVVDILSPELKDLITRMLEPEPKLRITIREIMRHPWFKSSQSSD